MVGVGGIEASDDPRLDVVVVVAVGVLEVEEIGACATITPLPQNSNPVGLWRSPAKVFTLSVRPSPLVSSRIRSLSFIGSSGRQCG
jgi:hypothetical protein